MRRIRYQEIADELRGLAAGGAAGSLLPSESELSGRYSVSRVTVRRALELLRDEGLIAARQGFGWFVAGEPVRQRLEHLGTIEDQLQDSGRHGERKVIEFAFEPPPERVREILGVDQVLRVKRVNLADGEPFAVVTVWCPAELGGSLSREDVERHPFYEITADEWDKVSAVNIKGPFLCAKAVFPQMKEQKSGKIINISSSTAYWGTPNFLHYVASKAALIGMTRSLAREVGDYGICVNAIAPGLVEHEGQNAPKALTELQLKERSIKRLQTPEDLLGVLTYLASSDSDFVTGQTIVIDGGSILY